MSSLWAVSPGGIQRQQLRAPSKTQLNRVLPTFRRAFDRRITLLPNVVGKSLPPLGFPLKFERRLTAETKLADKIAKAVRPMGTRTGVFFDVDEGAGWCMRGLTTLTPSISASYDPDVDAAEHAADEGCQYH